MTASALVVAPEAIDPISLDDAYARIRPVLEPIHGTELVPLGRAADRVLADAALSPTPLPMFDNSAVDGFGIHRHDLEGGRRLEIVGRLTAGAASNQSLKAGQALYLATGAPVPPGVDAVVMQEKTVAAAGGVVAKGPVLPGANIRRSGEDVPDGSVLVEAGTLLDYRHIGLLASAGVTEVEVSRRVRIILISTGTEVRPAGERLQPGQIYDANGPMLSALLAREHVDLVDVMRVPDDAAALAALLTRCGQEASLIITTGGAAGSDSDHALRALLDAGGDGTALRMALRPGKPMVVGRIGACAVLSLPGNPQAALINFLLFVRPAIQALAGRPFQRPRGQAALAAQEIVHTAGRTEFAPGRIVAFAADGRPTIDRIGRGGSARLRPLVEADGFIELDPDRARLDPGSPIVFHPFKASFAP